MSNFTEDQTADIIDRYMDVMEADYAERAKRLEGIAAIYDKTVPQIRGVLVAAKVYIKKEATKTTDSEGDSMDKEAILKAITIVTGKDMPSFKNASKKDLTTLWEWIVSTSDRNEADS